MERITSLQNKKVKIWTSLQTKKGRDEHQLFLVETEHLIEEANNAHVLKAILSDEDGDILVTKEIIRKLKTSQSTIHKLGLCAIPHFEKKRYKKVILLDEVQDPGNLGTIIRTAKSFGFGAIYCSENCCDAFNAKCVQSSQGAIFSMPIFRQDLKSVIAFLKKQGLKVLGTSLKKSIPLKEVQKINDIAILLGNEGQGVKDELLALCDEITRIEMDGFESLNVAIAGAILMYTLQ
ncbi:MULTISPECIES: RNA methyltransferase [Terrabacteria group]|uniref:TrmH family RNA methyltransferase n=1 Tax=Bacillati TaxID=1783272 RepID=UPI001C6F507A|nr:MULTISPECIES: RNA methyltransferase [Terrabacteria group]MBW9212251.1 RNA methyltransferase [Trueperella sp. zg.1013]